MLSAGSAHPFQVSNYRGLFSVRHRRTFIFFLQLFSYGTFDFAHRRRKEKGHLILLHSIQFAAQSRIGPLEGSELRKQHALTRTEPAFEVRLVPHLLNPHDPLPPFAQGDSAACFAFLSSPTTSPSRKMARKKGRAISY